MSKNRRKPVKYYSPKRRAVYARGDDIDPLLLFELFDWRCYICKEPIDKRLRKPHWYAATIEHVVPLCKGGEHVWSNCVPAHARCNWSKGDSLLSETVSYAGQQSQDVVRLFPVDAEPA